MGSYSPSPFTYTNASNSTYKGLSPSEDFAFLMWCNSFDQGLLKLVTKQRRFPILVCFWWLWKTSPLSALYDLIYSLSSRQNNQVLITAPLECDSHSVLKHEELHLEICPSMMHVLRPACHSWHACSLNQKMCIYKSLSFVWYEKVYTQHVKLCAREIRKKEEGEGSNGEGRKGALGKGGRGREEKGRREGEEWRERREGKKGKNFFNLIP